MDASELLQRFQRGERTFKDAKLPKAFLFNAQLKFIDFSFAELTEADFRGAELFGANFQSANLNNASFGGANLARANFSGAKLQGADLRGTNLKSAILAAAIYDAQTRLPEDINPKKAGMRLLN